MWHGSLGGQGVLSEYVKAYNYAVSVVPDTVNAKDAATLPSAAMSALIVLEKLRLEAGETILIEAGAVDQFAKERGAKSFTTASKVNHKLLKKLGSAAVFDYKDPRLCEKIRRELGPQGFDAVLDSVGGESTMRNIELMRFCGRIACLKALPSFNPKLIYQKSPTINTVSLGGAWLDNSLCAQQKMGFMSNLLLEKMLKGEL